MTIANWVGSGLCAGKSEMFFPELDDTDWQEEPARELCRQCDYQLPCRDYAVNNREPYGIWGDTNPDDRRKIKMREYKSLPALLASINGSIEDVVDDYMLAKEILDAKSKMQTLRLDSRTR